MLYAKSRTTADWMSNPVYSAIVCQRTPLQTAGSPLGQASQDWRVVRRNPGRTVCTVRGTRHSLPFPPCPVSDRLGQSARDRSEMKTWLLCGLCEHGEGQWGLWYLSLYRSAFGFTGNSRTVSPQGLILALGVRWGAPWTPSVLTPQDVLCLAEVSGIWTPPWLSRFLCGHKDPRPAHCSTGSTQYELFGH